MVRAFIGIGSNIEPENNVKAAILSLAQQARVKGISTVYCTEALGHIEQPAYYNCVVEIETDIAPRQVKREILHEIEDSLGRKRTVDKYAPRTIDLDLIIYGETAINAADLCLPDPDILERPFLAIPLFELAPELVLPGYDLCICEVAAGLPAGNMIPLESYTRQVREALSCLVSSH